METSLMRWKKDLGHIDAIVAKVMLGKVISRNIKRRNASHYSLKIQHHLNNSYLIHWMTLWRRRKRALCSTSTSTTSTSLTTSPQILHFPISGSAKKMRRSHGTETCSVRIGLVLNLKSKHKHKTLHYLHVIVSCKLWPILDYHRYHKNTVHCLLSKAFPQRSWLTIDLLRYTSWRRETQKKETKKTWWIKSPCLSSGKNLSKGICNNKHSSERRMFWWLEGMSKRI